MLRGLLILVRLGIRHECAASREALWGGRQPKQRRGCVAIGATAASVPQQARHQEGGIGGKVLQAGCAQMTQSTADGVGSDAVPWTTDAMCAWLM